MDAQDTDDRIETIARIIFDGYAALNGSPDRWDCDYLAASTRAKYRRLADIVLDQIEWSSFKLAHSDER